MNNFKYSLFSYYYNRKHQLNTPKNNQHMLTTILPNKQTPKIQKHHQKIGISVISCNIVKGASKNLRHQVIGSLKQQSRKSESYKPLRSLSAQRIRRKRQKMEKKTHKFNQGLGHGPNMGMRLKQPREQMKQNLNQLEAQYDQLKLKRSLMTQRQSQKSNGKVRFSDLEDKSDAKANNSLLLMSKCVPKSKISLNLINLQTNGKIQEYEVMGKQNNNQANNNFHLGKNRQASLYSSSLSKLQVSHLSESICSSSLSNLQVIPIGLNVSLAKNSRVHPAQQPRNSNRRLSSNSETNQSQMYRSFQRKKGIKVLSSKKINCPNIANQMISLTVMKQVEDKNVSNGLKSGHQSSSACRRNLSGQYFQY